jgi:hypothetical protein
MPFAVRVASEKAGDDKFREGRSTHKAAVAATRKLISQGIEGVTLWTRMAAFASPRIQCFLAFVSRACTRAMVSHGSCN